MSSAGRCGGLCLVDPRRGNRSAGGSRPRKRSPRRRDARLGRRQGGAVPAHPRGQSHILEAEAKQPDSSRAESGSGRSNQANRARLGGGRARSRSSANSDVRGVLNCRSACRSGRHTSKPTCRCHQDPKYLHGPYYRWTGWINGRPTTKSISEEIAQECQKRIENYRELQKKIEETVADAIDQAPWTKQQKK